MSTSPNSLPIGVFDSGVGGLTVLRALQRHLPQESFVYLGDTARLPYGSKSPQTVLRYAEQAAQILVHRGIKLLVIACNTASAVALVHLQERFAPLPVVGVIEPGAQAACHATTSGHILVIATEGTVRGGAYERAIYQLSPTVIVRSTPCPLFVALAEEGWIEGPVALQVAHRYLDPLLKEDQQTDCLVLGCTHFPVLRDTIQQVVGSRIRLVDSAETTAKAVVKSLESFAKAEEGLVRPVIQFLATDAPSRFARVGAVFLGQAIPETSVELVDL